jgi:hypothetical protein
MYIRTKIAFNGLIVTAEFGLLGNAIQMFKHLELI